MERREYYSTRQVTGLVKVLINKNIKNSKIYGYYTYFTSSKLIKTMNPSINVDICVFFFLKRENRKKKEKENGWYLNQFYTI